MKSGYYSYYASSLLAAALIQKSTIELLLKGTRYFRL